MKAENLFKEKNLLEKHIILINNLENEINDAEELLNIGNDENDTEIVEDAEETIQILWEWFLSAKKINDSSAN